MSALNQPYHEEFVKDIGKLKTIWTLRNDDNYYYRWGAPDFVREFIKNIPFEVSRGLLWSDQWVWAREFTMKEPESPRQLEIVKHWFHWMLWGRLGYDPGLSNDRIIEILEKRFPEVSAENLFNVWQEALMIYPTTTGFHWGRLDFQWYIEACKSREGYAQNETGFQSIPDFVRMSLSGGSSDLKSPNEVSVMLHSHADRAISLLGEMSSGNHTELAYILHDIRTMAYLGKYYTHKIAGSLNVAMFRETDDKKYQEDAVKELEDAL